MLRIYPRAENAQADRRANEAMDEAAGTRKAVLI
jgi:hypothetical protein